MHGCWGKLLILSLGLAFGVTPAHAFLSDLCRREILKRVKGGTVELEIEIKYELDEKNYEKLIRKVNGSKAKTTNYTTYYFDSKSGELRENGLNLRLRVYEDGESVLTLKTKADVKIEGPIAPKARWELNAPINARQSMDFLNPDVNIWDEKLPPLEAIKKEFKGEELPNLKLLGSVRTNRTIFKISAGPELHIDHYNIRGNEEGYEVEVEVHDAKQVAMVHTQVTKLFDEWGIEYRLTQRSKRSRL